jgi:hypothetical protein
MEEWQWLGHRESIGMGSLKDRQPSLLLPKYRVFYEISFEIRWNG